jgi:MFS family permease
MVLRVLLEALSLLILVAVLSETRRELAARGDDVQQRWRLRQAIASLKAMRGFVMALGVDAFAWGLGAALLFGMLSQTYGFTTVQLGAMLSLQCLVWSASQVLMGRWADRYGCKRLMLLSDAIGLLVLAGWLSSRCFAAFALWYVLYGLVFSTWGPAHRAYATRRLPEAQRAEVMGWLAGLRGLARFVAPYLGGLLFERFGFRAPLWANLVGVVAALWAIRVGVEDSEPRPDSVPAMGEAS